MKKIIFIITILFLLVISTAGIWAYLAIFYTKPLTQAELKDLTPDWTKATQGNWSPWFTEIDGSQSWNPAASFNQWLATIPDDQKAWPVLVDTYHANEKLFDRDLTGAEPGTEEWDKLTQLLDQPETKATIARLVEALNRPHMGCGLYTTTGQHEHDALIKHGKEDDNWNPSPEPNPGIYNILLPTYGKHRNAVFLLTNSAKHDLISNHPDKFLNKIQAIYNSAKYADEFPVIISLLVGIAIENQTQNTIAWALEHHPDQFTDTHLATFQILIGNQSNRTMNWIGEAMTFHDICRRVATAEGKLDPLKMRVMNGINSEPTHLPDAQLHASTTRTLMVYNTSVMQTTPLSRFDRDDTLQSSEQLYLNQKHTLNKTGSMIADLFRPSLDKAAQRNRQHIYDSFATQLILAIHRHKLRHGEFPNSITTIDTDLLPITPLDAFSGELLKYKLADAGPLIYSVGDDRTDDGGTQRWTMKDYGQYGSPPLLARVVSRPDWSLTKQQATQKLKDDPTSITGDWILFPTPQDDPEPYFDDGDD